MKTNKQNGTQNRRICAITLIAIIAIAMATALIGCKGEDEPPPPQDLPKDQGGTGNEITNLFGKGYSVTVKGYLTDTEWIGIAGKIEIAFTNITGSIPVGPAKDAFEGMFSRGIIIVVEKNPTYSNWKTTDDGKTVFINLNTVNGNDLQTNIYNALETAYFYTAETN